MPDAGAGNPSSSSPVSKEDTNVADSGSDRELQERNQRIYTDVVARYYGDPDFKARMDADPAAVLRAEGLDVPEGARVELLFNTDELVHIVLPAPN